jgi:ABC-type phosphate transport system auxiliary subunit
MEDAQLAVIAALRARIADQLNHITEQVMEIFEEKIEDILIEMEETIQDGDLEDYETHQPISQEVSDLLAEQRRIERELNGQ